VSELARVTDIGKWYDPVSQRWIELREAYPEAVCAQPRADRLSEFHDANEVHRIWQALLDCCARG
jgi:hypothetical protein